MNEWNTKEMTQLGTKLLCKTLFALIIIGALYGVTKSLMTHYFAMKMHTLQFEYKLKGY